MSKPDSLPESVLERELNQQELTAIHESYIARSKAQINGEPGLSDLPPLEEIEFIEARVREHKEVFQRSLIQKNSEGILENPELVGGRFNNCPDGWGCRVVSDNLSRAFDLEGNGIEVFAYLRSRETHE